MTPVAGRGRKSEHTSKAYVGKTAGERLVAAWVEGGRGLTAAAWEGPVHLLALLGRWEALDIPQWELAWDTGVLTESEQ